MLIDYFNFSFQDFSYLKCQIILWLVDARLNPYSAQSSEKNPTAVVNIILNLYK